MLNKIINVGLVAGEHSGDIIGAGLIRNLRNYLSKVNFVGIAGPLMQAEGMESWYNINELSVIGIAEIFKYIPKLFLIRRNLIHKFLMLKIDIFIGIDSPDFIIPLEYSLKKHNICTVHYISPSIWAWRKNRILKMKKSIDKILVALPFEKKIYDKYNISCKFVGHTLADVFPLKPNKLNARLKIGIPSSAICLAILPGSRYREILMLSANFLKAAEILSNHFIGLKILVPLINKNTRSCFEKIKSKVTPNLNVKILNNQSHQVMIASDVALLASGTATLECMLAKCPMVVGYRVHPLTYMLLRKIVKTPFISLPNILAKRKLVEELIQKDCCPELLAKSLINILNSKDKYKFNLIKNFYKLHLKIKRNADKKAALSIVSLIRD